MIIQKSITKLIMLIVIFGTTFLAYAQKNPQKPNIIFILADDFGYSSLNAYGADKNLVRTTDLSLHANMTLNALRSVTT